MSDTFRNSLAWPVSAVGYRWVYGDWTLAAEGRLEAVTRGVPVPEHEVERWVGTDDSPVSVGQDGEIQSWGDEGEWFLEPVDGAFTVSHPESDPRLFLTFAALPPYPAAIRGFANTHGLLVGDNGRNRGESVYLWRQSIEAVGHAVDGWSFAQGRSRLSADDIVRRLWSHEPHDAVSDQPPRQLRTLVGRKVLSIIERQGELGRTMPRLKLIGAGGRLSAREESGPVTLLGVIWRQVIRFVTGERDWRVCGYRKCSTLIEISREANGATTRREYCSDSCRSLESRWRLRARARGRKKASSRPSGSSGDRN
jgi:hypothetical protein